MVPHYLIGKKWSFGAIQTNRICCRKENNCNQEKEPPQSLLPLCVNDPDLATSVRMAGV